MQCSNLTFYNYLVENIFDCENLKNVEYPLHVNHRVEPLKIDIVCDNGTTWIKVIARNSKTINDVVEGRAEYGAKSILDQAEEYIDAAEENHCFFKRPRVVFKFACRINDELVNELTTIGIDVIQGDESIRGNTEPLNFIIDKMNNKFNIDEPGVINLDISTLLAYVSSLTNGRKDCVFSDPLLMDQAKCEQKIHVKEVLDMLFKNKRLICCETAVTSFKNIINMLAGAGETERATEILEKLEILPDVDEIDEQLSQISVSGKIKERSLFVFSFGLQHQAITATSNEGFIRSVKMQGIDIPAFIHEARALTEMKEINM